MLCGLRAKAPHMLACIAALAPSHLAPPSRARTSPPRSRSPFARPLAQHRSRTPRTCCLNRQGRRRAARRGARDLSRARGSAGRALLEAPRLPPSAPVGSSCTASATLPVLPLTLPSPHAFAILHAFMYTDCLAPALAAFLPLPPAFLASSSSKSHSSHGEELTHATLLAILASRPSLHALALHLSAASSSNLSMLMGHVGHVNELWPDVVALGVYDPELWDAPSIWRGRWCLGALNLAAQKGGE
ncbi:hypothetical protein DFH09DRAFT_1473675 [Mycena vulgaris]|nr:hypothetical protein DFH09DRAFT_1473675 [Mycena vulgaris]